MSMVYESAILHVDCAYCGRRQGQPCMNRQTGGMAERPHLLRVNTYRLTMTREEWRRLHESPKGNHRFNRATP